MIFNKRIKSLVNVIKLNSIIIKFKFLKPNCRVIFFYHPKKLLTLINIKYLKDLFDELDEKYLILYGHEVDDFYEKNYFYISHSFLLRWIFNIDIFFSNYVCDVFTKNSIKIYKHV